MEEAGGASLVAQPEAVASFLAGLRDVSVWRRKGLSAVLFLSGLSMFLLVRVGDYTLLTLCANIVLLDVLVAAVYVNGRRMAGMWKDLPARDAVVVDDATGRAWGEALARAINGAYNTGVRLLYCADMVFVVKVAVALLLLSLVGRLMDGVTVLMFAFLFCFLFPPFYLKHTAWVDAKLGAAKTVFSTILATRTPDNQTLKAKAE